MTDIVSFVDEGLGNSSYLVNLGDGRCLLIDPVRDPRAYLAAAERRGLTISHTVETHLHADCVTGSRELAARGVVVLAPAAGQIEWPHQGLDDGDEVDLGGLRLRTLATPGHTPEHLAYLLCDADKPMALFSGGSLLVGAVARTDLIAPERTETLARSLWRSITDRLLVLPDDLAVYPTHGGGSFCSAPAEMERTTTIGRERAANPLLAAPDEDGFVKMLLDGLGTYPRYFLQMREINRRGPRVYGTYPELTRLEVGEVHRLIDGGAVIVDVRRIRDFAAGHLPGSLSMELRPQFATWLGWLVSRDTPLVFVADEGTDRAELVRQCLNIGYENLAGELAGGVAGWEAAGEDLERTDLLPAAAARGRVLDVRQESEFESGHIPGALHVELGSLAEALVRPGPVTVMCGHGERAMTAASLLARRGRSDLVVAIGGPDEWAAATGRPLQSG